MASPTLSLLAPPFPHLPAQPLLLLTLEHDLGFLLPAYVPKLPSDLCTFCHPTCPFLPHLWPQLVALPTCVPFLTFFPTALYAHALRTYAVSVARQVLLSSHYFHKTRRILCGLLACAHCRRTHAFCTRTHTAHTPACRARTHTRPFTYAGIAALPA